MGAGLKLGQDELKHLGFTLNSNDKTIFKISLVKGFSVYVS